MFKKIFMVFSLSLISIMLLLCFSNKTTVTDDSSEEVKNISNEEVYAEIKEFMLYDFCVINNNISNICVLDNGDYILASEDELFQRKILAKERLNKLNDIIELTKDYENVQAFFKDMKIYITYQMETFNNLDYYLSSAYGYRTTRYDKPGYLFYDLKNALINDGFNQECIDDWLTYKVY